MNTFQISCVNVCPIIPAYWAFYPDMCLCETSLGTFGFSVEMMPVYSACRYHLGTSVSECGFKFSKTTIVYFILDIITSIYTTSIVCLCVFMFVCVWFLSLSVHLPEGFPFHLSLSAWLYTWLSACLPVCLSVFLLICRTIKGACVCVSLSVCTEWICMRASGVAVLSRQGFCGTNRTSRMPWQHSHQFK